MDKGYYLLAVAGLLATVYAYQNGLMAQGDTMKLTSKNFKHNEPIPPKHTHYDANIPPHLAWNDLPKETKNLVLIVDDPDAPTAKPFVHAVVYNIDPQQKELKEGAWQGVTFGMTDFNKTGYQGPKPPKGHGTHHYHFRLYALDTPLDLPAGVSREEVDTAMEKHILGQTELIGTYIAE